MSISFINVFLVLLITPLGLSTAKICITTVMEVHIFNKLPFNLLPLQIHCESGDDDLGQHSLAIDEDYHWRFCEAFMGSTLYFCQFQWGIRYKKFNVFNDVEYCLDGLKSPNRLHYCKWEVRNDGFYLEQYNVLNDTYHMTFLYEWH
ncbi:hypothetical protein R3W88_025697 [Solanum pinnatisectum]|uniref:S-protein homolog n=1 Tax=Solanum pinnatisectum TaxID=50273 RepID=A0AAV9M761_9SOLN|nr:hypothetical protein R3W88_025697 [Solanum pinnatisectum]